MKDRLFGKIGPFRTIDNRPAFHSRLTSAGAYIGMCTHQPNRHRQREMNLVSALPRTADCRIPFLKIQRHGGSIDIQRHRRQTAVRIGIKVAGDRMILRPAGNPQIDGKLSRLSRADRDGHIAVPRIAACLGYRHLCIRQRELGGAGRIQIDVKFILGAAVHIARQGRNGAGDIPNAAVAGKPAASRIAAGRNQRIGIKECIPLQRDPAKQGIVKGSFQCIDISAVPIIQKHPVIPHHIGNLSTRFTIAVMRQLIRGAERFSS